MKAHKPTTVLIKVLELLTRTGNDTTKAEALQAIEGLAKSNRIPITNPKQNNDKVLPMFVRFCTNKKSYWIIAQPVFNIELFTAFKEFIENQKGYLRTIQPLYNAIKLTEYGSTKSKKPPMVTKAENQVRSQTPQPTVLQFRVMEADTKRSIRQ